MTTATLETTRGQKSSRRSSKGRKPRNARPAQPATVTTEKRPKATAGFYDWQADINKRFDGSAVGFVQRPAMGSVFRISVSSDTVGQPSVIGDWLYAMVDANKVKPA